MRPWAQLSTNEVSVLEGQLEVGCMPLGEQAGLIGARLPALQQTLRGRAKVLA